MSWWESYDGSTIGDTPADIADDVLVTLAGAQTTARGSKPTLQAVVDALSAVLRTDSAGIGGTATGVVAAVGDSGATKTVSTTTDAPDPAVVAALASGVHRLAKAYRDELQRPPTIKEVLAVFLFVLGSDAERYLSDVTGTSLESLRARDDS